MDRVAKPFIVLFLASCTAALDGAQTTPQPCPVSYTRLQMPLRHRGGLSTPLVQLSFTNETKKKIERAKFGLLIMDSDGVNAPYGKALNFSAGAEPGRNVDVEWALDLEKLDIEHQGETVYLISAQFSDGTAWKDDGSQRCSDVVYFGPK